MNDAQRPGESERTSDVQDAEPAALAQAGDREAFGVLVGRYAAQARRVAYAVLGNAADADDAAQDGFLSALKNLGRYDPHRPFGPWLLRIVANAATDRLRRGRVRAAEALPGALAAPGPGPDRATDAWAFHDALRSALGKLPERQRMAVVLFDVEGYSHAEIADMLRVPQGTVRSYVFHARRALRGALAPWKDWKEEAK